MNDGKRKLDQIEIADTAAALFAKLPAKESASGATQIRAVNEILRANPDLSK